jgi:hypothetical protein
MASAVFFLDLKGKVSMSNAVMLEQDMGLMRST